MQRISIIIPLFNEEDTVDELMKRLTTATAALPFEFEFVFVNDGSADGTLGKLLDWRDRDRRVTAINLSRNWGHQRAYNAGIDWVEGSDAVIFMDGDLEDPPEVISELIDAWQAGHDVVHTTKRSRGGSMFRRFLTSCYYSMLRAVTQVKLEKQSGMFSLLSNKAFLQLKRFVERNKSYPNLRFYVGFKSTVIAYDRGNRFHGEPRQTLCKLFNDAMNAFISFSNAPLRLMGMIGLGLTSLFIVLSLAVFGFWVTDTEFWIFHRLPGWTSSILLILAVSSFNIMFLGLIGEYLTRIYDEVRGRPYYLVDAVYPSACRMDDVPGEDWNVEKGDR